LLAIVMGAMLTGFYQSKTESLVMDTAHTLFDQAATKITLAFQKTYRPVQELTSVLSRAPQTSNPSLAARKNTLPVFISALQRQPETVAISIGYDNGDYFIVRAAASEKLRTVFEAPAGTVYIADHLVQADNGNALMTRQFLNDDQIVIEERRLDPMVYDPRTRPWFTAAMATDEIVMTEPYAFFFFRQPGLTVARQTEDGKAVVASDITLESLSGTLNSLSISPSAHSVLYLPNGTAMAYSDGSKMVVTTRENQSRIAQVDELDIPVMLSLDGENPIEPPEGWMENTVVLPLTDQLQPRLTIAAPSRDILGSSYLAWHDALWTAIAIIALSLPLTWLIARSVSGPIRALRTAVGHVSEGNFDFHLPDAKRRDEVGELTRAFRSMRTSLRQHIEELKQTTAAKERLESELEIAREIQMSMVPGDGELNRQLRNWDMAATLRPARAVGGDLFDIAELPGGKLLVTVGDVSDKGVPAALFMARTVSLMKLLYGQGHSLQHLMHELNQHLALDNESCMFVTLLCLIVDTDTGAIEMSSAGHSPPVLVSEHQAQLLEMENGPPMGIHEDIDFPCCQASLPVGCSLILYTDGVTEAFSPNREEFGEDRMLASLAAIGSPDSNESVRGLLDAVTRFAADADQSDDITVLALKRL